MPPIDAARNPAHDRRNVLVHSKSSIMVKMGTSQISTCSCRMSCSSISNGPLLTGSLTTWAVGCDAARLR